MAVEVKLPRLGQGMESGTIVRWLKAEGEAVAKGDPLYELDTDKVTQEVEAEAAGVLLRIVVADGEVDVGETVAVIGAQDEDVSEILAGAQGGNGGAPAVSPEPGAAPRAVEEASGSEPDGVVEPAEQEIAPPSRRPGERVKASPLARRIARERGIDLTSVPGTGPEGRVIAEDVETAASRPPSAAVAAAPTPPFPPGLEVEVVELTSTRRTIARRLTEAWQAPVFQLSVTADSSRLVEMREQLVELLNEGDVKPTVNDVLIRLVAAALMRHRPVNAHFVDGRVLRFPSANVGIAVAAPTGLVVPVIRNAERKSVLEIAGDRADLVTRARAGKLQLVDLENGSFTVSNLGMYGIEQFIAVLNPPQVAILAVGSIEERAIVAAGELAIAPTMTMTLTCDHRAIDGSEGAEFLRTVKALVENPALAL
ncbi:MAG TPA: dihydrolipoamide acetyltransferase family protein [Gaiellaceae bacterium]|nr:dihydrolipoamide acetyltransferase family protein [Gaiellaceae bacterium]